MPQLVASARYSNGKQKRKKDKDTDGENAENKTDSKKIEVVTSPEDIITDEKEERKI